MKKSSPGQRRSRGQALVEFALVIPVFLTILFGILDFGFLLYSRITLSSATREGAHAAITQIDNPVGVPAIVKSTILANSTGLTWPAGLANWPDGQVPVTPSCVANPATLATHPSCAWVASGPSTPVSGDLVRVTTIYEYHSFFAQFFGAPVRVDATTTMVIE